MLITKNARNERTVTCCGSAHRPAEPGRYTATLSYVRWQDDIPDVQNATFTGGSVASLQDQVETFLLAHGVRAGHARVTPHRTDHYEYSSDIPESRSVADWLAVDDEKDQEREAWASENERISRLVR